MTSANEKQIGGEHYKSEYQHWDFVKDLELPYLHGCATKYVTRAFKKNGEEDLRKAIHYVDKILETTDYLVSYTNEISADRLSSIDALIVANKLSSLQRDTIICLVQSNELSLNKAKAYIFEMIVDIEKAKVSHRGS